MTYVVTELCVDCKYTDCAAVCPVEAFHDLPDRLYINPDTCIDCDACVPECPVEAIFADTTLPEHYQEWLALNAEAANLPDHQRQDTGPAWAQLLRPAREAKAWTKISEHPQAVLTCGCSFQALLK